MKSTKEKKIYRFRAFDYLFENYCNALNLNSYIQVENKNLFLLFCYTQKTKEFDNDFGMYIFNYSRLRVELFQIKKANNGNKMVSLGVFVAHDPNSTKRKKKTFKCEHGGSNDYKNASKIFLEVDQSGVDQTKDKYTFKVEFVGERKENVEKCKCYDIENFKAKIVIPRSERINNIPIQQPSNFNQRSFVEKHHNSQRFSNSGENRRKEFHLKFINRPTPKEIGFWDDAPYDNLIHVAFHFSYSNSITVFPWKEFKLRIVLCKNGTTNTLFQFSGTSNFCDYGLKESNEIGIISLRNIIRNNENFGLNVGTYIPKMKYHGNDFYLDAYVILSPYQKEYSVQKKSIFVRASEETKKKKYEKIKNQNNSSQRNQNQRNHNQRNNNDSMDVDQTKCTPLTYNAYTFGFTKFHMIVASGDIEKSKTILLDDYRCNYVEDDFGNLPIAYACEKDMMQLLLEFDIATEKYLLKHKNKNGEDMLTVNSKVLSEIRNIPFCIQNLGKNIKISIVLIKFRKTKTKTILCLGIIFGNYFIFVDDGGFVNFEYYDNRFETETKKKDSPIELAEKINLKEMIISSIENRKIVLEILKTQTRRTYLRENYQIEEKGEYLTNEKIPGIDYIKNLFIFLDTAILCNKSEEVEKTLKNIEEVFLKEKEKESNNRTNTRGEEKQQIQEKKTQAPSITNENSIGSSLKEANNNFA